MAVETAPCDWPLAQCGPLPPEDDPLYEPLKDAATGVLWALSGRQFGCCRRTTRYCREQSYSPAGEAWLRAELVDGRWVNLGCQSCGTRCGCTGTCEIRIDGPVCGLHEVLVDGEAVPTGSFRVDDGDKLVRTDGECFPLGKPVEVTFSTGVPVPAGGRLALGELFSELWKACPTCDAGTCSLPKRIQVIVKGGMTVGFLDPMEFLRNGKTGLYYTDLWLSSVNPLARPQAARAMSPDWPGGRTTTWPT